MSINSLTNAELKRHATIQLSAAVPRIAGSLPPPLSNQQAQAQAVLENNQVTNALNALTQYIPTEVITLYVAAVSIAPAVKTLIPWIGATGLYWGFGVMTSLLLLLVQMSKLRAAGLPIPPLSQWPWWKAAAATIAFLIWALAVPNNPYIAGEVGGAVVGFFAMFISYLLSLVTPFFEH